MLLQNSRLLCIGNGGLHVISGVALTDRTQADFLVDLKSEVGSVTFCHWAEPVDEPLARFELEKFGVVVLALKPLRGPVWTRAIRAIAAFRALILEILRSDFAYLYWPGKLSEIAALVCFFCRVPYGMYLRGGDDFSVQRSKFIVQRARFVITAGSELARSASCFAQVVEKVTPMLWLKPEHFRMPVEKRNRGCWRILYVGRIERTKGVVELIQATQLLLEHGHKVELTLVGYYEAQSNWMGQYGLQLPDCARFVGATTDHEELAEFYRQSDCLVLPSYTEGFPRVLYEAMAFGLPVVTTFVGSVRSVMMHGENCLQIMVGSSEDIAEKIEMLMENEVLAFQIAMNGYMTVTTLSREWLEPHSRQVVRLLAP